MPCELYKKEQNQWYEICYLFYLYVQYIEYLGGDSALAFKGETYICVGSGVVGGAVPMYPPLDMHPLEPEAGRNIFNLPRILEFGGSIYKTFNYLLLIL